MQTTTTTTTPLFDDQYTGPRYRYGLSYRPVGLANVPRGYIIQSDRPSDVFLFGTIDYPFVLPFERAKQADLTPIVRPDVGAVAPTLADGAGHDWRDIGYADSTCRLCGLSPWTAEGTGNCRGRRTFVCGVHSCGWTHGLCVATFDSQKVATAHWLETHAASFDETVEMAALNQRGWSPTRGEQWGV